MTEQKEMVEKLIEVFERLARQLESCPRVKWWQRRSAQTITIQVIFVEHGGNWTLGGGK